MVGRLIPQPLVDDTQRNRVLLDRVLPDKPVVLVFDEFPDRALPPDTARALETAGAAIVGLTPEWMNPVDGIFPVYRDAAASSSGPQMRAYLGHALLLRQAIAMWLRPCPSPRAANW